MPVSQKLRGLRHRSRVRKLVVFSARLEAQRKQQHIERIREANTPPCLSGIVDVEASARNAERLAKGASG